MNGTPIAWPLRAWFGGELFFAMAATISVALDPANTQANFAWTIKPEVMAALIGASFMALAPVLVLMLFMRRWENVRVFVLPGLAFTAAQLVVTFLHWDRFAAWTGPFNIWFASHLPPPPVFLACCLWQQGRAARMWPFEWPATASWPLHPLAASRPCLCRANHVCPGGSVAHRCCVNLGQ